MSRGRERSVSHGPLSTSACVSRSTCVVNRGERIRSAALLECFVLASAPSIGARNGDEPSGKPVA